MLVRYSFVEWNTNHECHSLYYILITRKQIKWTEKNDVIMQYKQKTWKFMTINRKNDLDLGTGRWPWHWMTIIISEMESAASKTPIHIFHLSFYDIWGKSYVYFCLGVGLMAAILKNGRSRVRAHFFKIPPKKL